MPAALLLLVQACLEFGCEKAKRFSFRLLSRRHGMANLALLVALSIRMNNEKSASVYKSSLLGRKTGYPEIWLDPDWS
jgi:hypothetical protein